MLQGYATMRSFLHRLTALAIGCVTTATLAGSMIPTTVTPTEAVAYPATLPMAPAPVPPLTTPAAPPLPPIAATPPSVDFAPEMMVITSTQQWSAIAKAAALEIAEALKQEPLYLEPVKSNSPPFLLAYQDFLIAHLIDAGVVVAANDRSAATVKIGYASQVVVHKNGCCQPPELTEVVITTRVIKGRRILVSSSKPFQFYLNDSSMYMVDVDQFMERNRLTPNRRYGVSR